jgi:RHS repeat-associated protein
VFVYDVTGRLIAEYHSDPVPPAAGGGGTSYLTSDHLGSTRVVTKADGSVKARYDYLPFGEEVPSTVGGRSGVAGYGSADSTRQKFTQKERDTESGLDYFGARYYSGAQGRFTSSDPLFSSAERLDPQTWNRYSYVTNNPMKYHDPTGERRNPVTSRRGIDPRPANGERGRIRANKNNSHIGEFGMTRNGGTRPHHGIDINAKVGTPLVAPESGTVTGIRVAGGYGNQLVIRTEAGETVTLNHLKGYAEGLKVGAKVSEGSVVAFSGNTGNAGGLTATNEDHTHFEVRDKNGQRVDPVDWLNDPNANVPLEINASVTNPAIGFYIGPTVTLNTSVSPDSPQVQQVSDWNYATGQRVSYTANQQAPPNPDAKKHTHLPPTR